MISYNLDKLFKDLVKKKNGNDDKSYTFQLLQNKNLLARKVGEESLETILEYLSDNKDSLIRESADLLYHLNVMWISADIVPDDIWNELHKRTGISGIDEKKNRKK